MFEIPQDLSAARILVTNDDGIHASGLEALREAMQALASDVWVVAPHLEQSGAGHSLTLHQPLRVHQHAPKRFSVTGTPTDCVLLAVRCLLPRDGTPTLLVSGINHGDNMAEHITYSGTIAAAMEGILLGLPSIAFSQSITGDEPPAHWRTGITAVHQVMDALRGYRWPSRALLSVNIPDCTPEALRGIRITRQGQRAVEGSLTIDARRDPRGRAYYWMNGVAYPDCSHDALSDCKAVEENYISLTPVSLDLTHEGMLRDLRDTLKRPDARHATA